MGENGDRKITVPGTGGKEKRGQAKFASHFLFNLQATILAVFCSTENNNLFLHNVAGILKLIFSNCSNNILNISCRVHCILYLCSTLGTMYNAFIA